MEEQTMEQPEIEAVEKPNDTASQSGSYGKFKDATSLLSAYENLQAEFTRKSQQLAKLSKTTSAQNAEPHKNENESVGAVEIDGDIGTKNDKSEMQKSDNNEHSQKVNNDVVSNNFDQNGENDSKIPVYKQQNWKNQVIDFFDECPHAKEYSQKIGEILLDEKELSLSKNALNLAYKLARAETLKEPAQLVEDDEFVSNIILKNDKIKERIVGDYVQSLNKSKTPFTISTGGSAVVTNPQKISSFSEAGKLLLKTLK